MSSLSHLIVSIFNSKQFIIWYGIMILLLISIKRHSYLKECYITFLESSLCYRLYALFMQKKSVEVLEHTRMWRTSKLAGFPRSYAFVDGRVFLTECSMCWRIALTPSGTCSNMFLVFTFIRLEAASSLQLKPWHEPFISERKICQ